MLAQTCTDFEVIVVDEGSRDHTASVAAVRRSARAGNQHSQRRCFSARNLGTAESRGELIAFLDADDLWQPAKLERQVALLNARPEVGICVTGRVTRIDTLSQLIAPVPLFDSAAYHAGPPAPYQHRRSHQLRRGAPRAAAGG